MMGRTMALYMATKVSVVQPQLDPAKAFMTLRALVTRLTQSRAKSEAAVQRDTQDFMGSVQWGHLVSNSHLWVNPGLLGVLCEQSLAF